MQNWIKPTEEVLRKLCPSQTKKYKLLLVDNREVYATYRNDGFHTLSFYQSCAVPQKQVIEQCISLRRIKGFIEV